MHLFHKEKEFKGVAKTHHFNAPDLGPNSNPSLYPQLKGISARKPTSANRNTGSAKGSKAVSVRSQKVASRAGDSSNDDNDDESMTIS
jgi:hypothetical protein